MFFEILGRVYKLLNALRYYIITYKFYFIVKYKKKICINKLTRSEKSRYSLFSGAGLVTVRTALYARLALSFRSSVSPSTFHGSLDDADARLF